MKEKDRALQVGYQQSGFLPSLVLFFFLIIPFRNHKSASRANVYLKNVDELFQMCVFRRNDPQNTQNRKFFQSIFSHTSCVLMQHGSSFPDLFDCFGCWLVSNRWNCPRFNLAVSSCFASLRKIINIQTSLFRVWTSLSRARNPRAARIILFFLRLKVVAEEKLRALQGKEAELQQLRQSLRERDRLIEKINSAVLESEEKNKVSQEKRHCNK